MRLPLLRGKSMGIQRPAFVCLGGPHSITPPVMLSLKRTRNA
jgi:hypothetical protein